MNGVAERSAEWIYRGIWIGLVHCFRVPDGPPLLPEAMHGALQVFHPSRRYLSYLKAYFWVGLVLVDLLILLGWLLIFWVNATIGWILAIPALVIAVLPDILAYIAIHLRYDTIWYAVSNRGLYVRRGIIVITEHTITLENIQNVSVRRGPIEQLFGIATLVVETAGASAHDEESSFMVGNQTIMVGLEDADELRELLMKHVRSSSSAGLGDDADRSRDRGWRATDLQLLEAIRGELKLLRKPQ